MLMIQAASQKLNPPQKKGSRVPPKASQQTRSAMMAESGRLDMPDSPSSTKRSIVGEDNFDYSESSSFSASLRQYITSRGQVTTKYAEEEKYREELTKGETKTIRRLKAALVAFLLCVAALIFAVVYKYTDNVQKNEFQSEFLQQGTKLISGFSSDSFHKLQALESLSKALTLRNESWPFVTISDSHELFEPFLSLANAASIKILPIVRARQRVEWEEHTAANQGWLDEDLASQVEAQAGISSDGSTRSRIRQYFEAEENRVSPYIKNYVGVDTSPGMWLPWWQYAPVIPNRWFLNFNQLADGDFYRDFQVLFERKHAILAKTETYLPGLDFQSTRDFTFTQELLAAGGYGQYQPGEPIGFIHYPVFRGKDNDEVVAVVSATVYWKTYFQDILPDTTRGMICVVENNSQQFTYKIDGRDAIFLGMSDLHDPVYDDFEISTDCKSFETDDAESTLTAGGRRRYTGVPIDESRNLYRIRVYPSAEMEEPFLTNEPWWYASLSAAIMILTATFFLSYDCFVEQRQAKLSDAAVRSNAVVSSLFPASVKDKLYQESRDMSAAQASSSSMQAFRAKMNEASTSAALSPQKRMMSLTGETIGTLGGKKATLEGGVDYMDSQDEDLSPDSESDPIADFFPSATVLFMDIAGFTAWSSSREPSQVFILLETIYKAFDKIAKVRRVFKVETIGDCYVAVCGLPEPCEKHARQMAVFALDCLKKMNQSVHRLEARLGPDTGELTVRVGIHSGSVTAGVLRGERARFQLFGDTVNTASRMESTGKPGMIQISQQTAQLLVADRKSSWIRERPDKVIAKGKGELKTFWLLPKSARSMGSSASKLSQESDSSTGGDEDHTTQYMDMHSSGLELAGLRAQQDDVDRALRVERLVKFNYDLLLNILRDIMAKYALVGRRRSPKTTHKTNVTTEELSRSCLEEVVEIIELPKYDHNMCGIDESERGVPSQVKGQLMSLCESVAHMYRDENPFHNFDHACHVIQSSSKLLSRIVAVKAIGNLEEAHDTTFGITSDPLTQFAVIFAAMIHDVDHRGVPNNVLDKEDPEMATLYQNHAIAEQHSVAIVWALFMEPQYDELRASICYGKSDLKRFRQLLVNCLMATDIFDDDLKAMRERRWKHAFHSKPSNESETTSTNRKATIVIEHIIQASDISHTMQHWHVYKKWNLKLFLEMYKAYEEGRTNSDPSEGWYEGELWFFDNYVIPLARKLEECGVFGVSSDEYLMYARANREEWEKKGEAIVKETMKRIQDSKEKRVELPAELPLQIEKEPTRV